MLAMQKLSALLCKQIWCPHEWRHNLHVYIYIYVCAEETSSTKPNYIHKENKQRILQRCHTEFQTSLVHPPGSPGLRLMFQLFNSCRLLLHMVAQPAAEFCDPIREPKIQWRKHVHQEEMNCKLFRTAMSTEMRVAKSPCSGTPDVELGSLAR